MGMNRQTGTALTGLAHLRQSIVDILTTPVGSRVMRRDYGSRLFELVDAPLNQSTLIEFYAATAEALDRWEPRFKLSSVSVDSTANGQITLNLQGTFLPEGREIKMEGLLV